MNPPNPFEYVATLLRKFQAAPPHRSVLVDFERFVYKRRRRLRLAFLSQLDFEDYLRARLCRGESVEDFATARAALAAFASSVGRADQFHAAVRHMARTLRLTKLGSCWVLEPYLLGGEQALAASGLPRHGSACAPGCGACRAGVRAGLWWTENPLLISGRLYVNADHATYCAFQEAVRLAQEEVIRRSRATASALEVPAPPGLSYLPFQKAGIAYALDRPATLLADEMGLGKTIQALGLVNADPSLQRVVVVCPATLLANWRREAEKWLVRAPKIHVCDLDNTVPPDDAGLVIVAYSRLRGPVLDVLMKRGWDLLIADEAHYAKNPDALRTRALLGGRSQPGLAQRARRLLFLTGTPMLNRPSELVTLLRALDPVAFAPSRIPFNPTILQQMARRTVMVRRLKADVLPELPPKRRSVIVLEKSLAEAAVAAEHRVLLHHAEELRVRRQACQASIGSDAAYSDAVRRLREARFCAQGDIFRARHLVALAKLPAVIDHANAILEEGVRKLVIWAHHRDVLDSIAAQYGTRAVLLTGDTPITEREAIVARFQIDPDCYVFVGSLRAAGQGITLTAAAHAVFAELDWTPAILTQAEDRCHRIGQRESLLVQHLVVDESIDAHLARVIVAKQELIRETLDAVPDDEAGLDLALAAA